MKQPFKINVDQTILDDLKQRLSGTRWPDEVDNDKWELGTNESYLKELCAYWQTDFDWRKQEALLNSFAQYTAVVDDFTLHFIYEEGKGTTRIPLLITHGWPDSIVRFYKLIPLLTAADENGVSFDVVAPSIPGFGFSEIPKEKGMNPKKIAGLFNELMTRELGYEKYYAHGGDWGSSITEAIALYHSQSAGIHLTDIPFSHSLKPPKDPSPAEEKFLKKTQKWVQTEGAYSSIQSTKPQSLAYGLNDSPAGLAGWIVEKFYAWSDSNGNIENAFSKDELLTNLTIYWATGTINSSMRIYYEAIQAIMQAMYNPLVKLNPFDKTGDKVETPTAFALFPKDISGDAPKEFAERFFNVQHWTEMNRGGHFAALEEPELLADDIRKFVKTQSDLK